MSKKWYMSKTLWANVLAIIAFAIQTFSGHDYFSPEQQGMILAVLNMFLRFVTKEKIIWK